MRKIVICGTSWCRPCNNLKHNLIPRIEKDCPDQIEYIDLQAQPSAVDKYKVYKIPMMSLVEDDEIVKRYVGSYPRYNRLIHWLKGDINDTDIC